MNPLVLGFLIRECVQVIQRRAPLIINGIVEAKHPDSEGGRRLTGEEKRAIIRKVLKRVAEESLDD